MTIVALLPFFQIFLSVVFADSDYNGRVNHCVDLKPQTSLDIEQIMGIWHGVEIIQHQNRRFPHPTEDICPVIFISETTPLSEFTTEYPNFRGYDPISSGSYDQQRNYNNQHNNNNQNYQNRQTGRPGYNRQFWRNLSLLWDEGAFTVEYNLRFERTKPGFWISSGPQNGSSVSLMDKKFNSFAGHVQVLKAVGTHLVLTFCHILPNNELFTIVLARQVQLDPQDIVSVHNLLSRRHLSTANARKVCRNNGMKLKYNQLALTAVIIMGLGKFLL